MHENQETGTDTSVKQINRKEIIIMMPKKCFSVEKTEAA